MNEKKDTMKENLDPVIASVIKLILDKIFTDIFDEMNIGGDSYFISKEGYKFGGDIGYAFEFLTDYLPILYNRYGIELPSEGYWIRYLKSLDTYEIVEEDSNASK